ncbi:hypothetical protein [Bradyrhizobium sp. SZCCHNR3107]|uniref:hypothetical protein n=1 Tax=Bradyrhizobium sp. SZCCHNR3107 TaxID=3057459 RepID=UPI0028EBB4D5|nr:hypothetical protein [Bradyrhizobium sp. SZCCHNR3107]
METYTRQQLHDLVWSGPMRDVSKKLGLSDNGLRKHCVKAFVPLPPQGHWNKLKAGHKVKTTPLPPRPPGISDAISIGKWDYRENNRRLMEAEPVPPVFDEPIEALRERVARNLGVVVASKSLSPPHAAFRRQVEDDARQATQSRWHTPIFDKPIEKRRLRILQGLFHGLSRLDCWATVQGRETRTISIGVGHQSVWVALERVEQRRRSSDEKEIERLKFSIRKGYGDDGDRISWMDTDGQPLEAQLSTIAAEIIVVGEMQYREHLEWVHNDAVRRREKMRQEEIRRKLEAEKAERERRIKLEADRLKRLTDSAENYQRAQAIRDFVSTIVALPAKDIDPERIARWREWALAQANNLDPIANGRIWDDVNDSA